MTQDEAKERLVQVGRHTTIYLQRNGTKDPEALSTVVLAVSIELGLIVVHEGTVRFEGNRLYIDGWRWATKRPS